MSRMLGFQNYLFMLLEIIFFLVNSADPDDILHHPIGVYNVMYPYSLPVKTENKLGGN